MTGFTPERPLEESPERILFTSGEAELCVKALAYCIHRMFNTPDGNFTTGAYNAIDTTVSDAMGSVRYLKETITGYAGLAERFEEATFDPDVPVELSPKDVERIGYAVYAFGTHGVRAARTAVMGELTFTSDSDRQGAADMVGQVEAGSYRLFKKLEPTVQAKPGAEWMVWPAPGAELPITE
jgi:hypothetical protein